MTTTKTVTEALRRLADILEESDLTEFYAFNFSMQTNKDSAYQPVQERLKEALPGLHHQDSHDMQVLEGSHSSGDSGVRVRAVCTENPHGDVARRVKRLRAELKRAEKQLGKVQA